EFGRYSSGALLAPTVRAELAKLPPDTPFYSIEMLDHTFPFYMGHTTIMVQRQDELGFGISMEPNKWIPTVDEWITRWKQETHALAIMPPGQYDALVTQGVPMRVIARDNRRVIVEKPQS
ncbi:4-amino-4-deoxy-L-arabinose transferase, partial [Burkholderia cepacia]|nr:4-amino-4-deoxy-L-arabinose transferase [Burkholderia cepacia]